MQFKFSKGDFFGGTTAGVVALPLALAFGVQSGMGAASGLYGAIFLGFFAALLGGTPSQISGPTGPMTVVTAATVSRFVTATGSLESALGALIACFVLAGLLQILMGVVKIGRLIKYIPYPVISGFMSGIGVIIILLQIFPAIGQASPKTTLDVVKSIGPAVASLDLVATCYTIATILIIYLFPKITKVVPSTLVALLAVTIASVLIGHEIPVIGDIPKGFPPLKLSGLLSVPTNLYRVIAETALTLAALGAIDSLLTSVVADNVTKTRHKSNRELIGQGIGNSISGLFGGIPGAGATMRTLVNIKSGGRERLSGVLHSLLLLAILLGLGKYAALIPKSVLAGILITVGIGILDYKGFRHIRKVPLPDASIMVIVLLVTVFFDLLIAVGIGMILASVLFMKKMADIVEERTSTIPMEPMLEGRSVDYEELSDELKNKVLIKNVDGPMFFGFASGFQREIDELPEIDYVIIRMKKVPYIDQTGLYSLEEAILGLKQRDIEVLLSGLQEQPEDKMRAIQLIPELVAEKHIFKDINAAVGWLKDKKY